jgi:acyl-CoA thioester hydrolase
MIAAPFRYTHRVTYAECTVGNHIYHSRYLDLLEAARGEFMRSLRQPVLDLQAAGYIFPVIEARLRYQAPARYDDLLAIEVWLTRAERVRLNFGHRITNQAGRLLVEAETFHCCTGPDEKPKRLPEDLLPKLKPFLRVPPVSQGAKLISGAPVV